VIRVSTIIPVFNGSVTLAAAIDSALSQCFQGQEVIVVNDGSTDATSKMIASYGSGSMRSTSQGEVRQPSAMLVPVSLAESTSHFSTQTIFGWKEG
jgi:glycosyltransferase involved in cell wall biosynthesis